MKIRTVSVLCCSRNSVYKSLPNLECYDKMRDARTFAGDMPVVAHPPCRCYSAFCRHQAKPDDREKEMALGVWCVEQVRACGGVVEQPAHSKLWEACNLPRPGMTVDVHKRGFSIEVPQYWFGYSMQKATWLWFSGLNPNNLPTMPFRLQSNTPDKRTWQLMSKAQRQETPRQFAEWLVSAARLSTFKL